MTEQATATTDAPVRALAWTGDSLHLLDQRRLPAEEAWIRADSAAEVAAAIRDMVVRGAPAIGIAAAYGIALAARRGDDLAAATAALAAARPTAVNLAWALARLQRCVDAGAGPDAIVAEAQAIHAEDVDINRRIGAAGAALLPGAGAVMTHCNTGALATGGHGTALGVVRSAWAADRLDEVWAGETRPWLQGARLTAWELQREGIPVRLFVEGAAAWLMQRGSVQAVIVGADRVAANGDVANKIGTCGLAMLAREHGIPFIVAAPVSTVDVATADGASIPVEQRPADEVLACAGQAIAPAGVAAWNPVFDITPARFVDALVTERGVIRDPGPDAIAGLVDTPAAAP